MTIMHNRARVKAIMSWSNALLHSYWLVDKAALS